MSTKQKFSWIFPSLIVVVLFCAGVFYPLYATTDTVNSINLGAPGALAPCYSAHGNSSATADALVISVPDGLTPGYMAFIPHYNSTTAATEGGEWEWYYGMTDNYDAIGHANGSTAEAHVVNSAFDFNGTTNTVTIPAAVQVNSGAYIFRICQ